MNGVARMKLSVLNWMGLLLSILVLCSCAQTSTKHPEPLGATPVSPDSQPSLDARLTSDEILAAIRKDEIVTVSVPSDAAYSPPHEYRAVALMSVLERLAKISSQRLDQSEIVFDCEDGYRAVLKGTVGREQTGAAYLAISDVHAAANEDWVPIKKPGGSITPGPLYLVWTNSVPEDHRPKPYQIVKVEILSGGDSQVAAYPSRDPMATAGFELFRKNCMNCHCINGVGGKVGIDLNYPMNVTEYWRKPVIRELIRNPLSVRSNARMPAFGQLTDRDIDLLVAYLVDMKSRKVTVTP